MAKYTVDYTCGHSKEVQLFGPEKDRKRKLEWMASQVCLDCENAQETTVAQAYSQSNNLPALQGSTDKGRAWAETIRMQEITSTERKLQEYEAKDKQRLTAEQFAESQPLRDRFKQLLEEAKQQTAVSWWLDHKDGMLEYDIRQTVRKEFS